MDSMINTLDAEHRRAVEDIREAAAKQARRRALAGAGQGRERARPLQILRESTKLVAGPLALVLTGARCKSLQQRLLTQASKIPSPAYLDMARLEQAAADMARLNREARTLLGAQRIAPDTERLGPLRQRASALASYLIGIYRLGRGEAPELDALAGLHPAGESGWNMEAIRSLLNAAFSDEEITTLCFDKFREVYDEFASGMSKGIKIQRLMEHCLRHVKMDELLAQVQARNPAQYGRFAPRVRQRMPSANG